jgi:ATP-binding cassette subfamily F protein uup
MDRLVDHLFVFEGEGKIKDFNGTYAEFRALRRTTAAATAVENAGKTAGKEDAVAKPASTAPALTNTERNEMKKLDKEIAAAEYRKKQILERFNAADLGADEAGMLSTELGQLQDALDEKEMRWLELSERS